MPKKAGIKLSTPLIDEFRRWLLEDIGRAERTVDGYRDAVEFFAATQSADTALWERQKSAVSAPNEERYWTCIEPRWEHVTLGDMEAFVREPLIGGNPPSKSTRRKRAYALKGFFEFLDDHNVIDTDPSTKLRGPGVQIGKPKPIPDDVWLQMWDQPLGIDDRVLLGLGYYVGLRRHEMIGIAPEHFDLERRRVAGFIRKGGTTNEVVYGGNLDIIGTKLPHLGVRLDEFENDLATLCRTRAHTGRLLALTEHVGIHEPNSAMNRRLTALSERCRVHVTPHMMRHSFGTNLLRAGVPPFVIASQMNHASLETLRGYADANQWYDTMEMT